MPLSPWEGCAVVVLAGGASERMGSDKLVELFPGPSTVLDAVLAGLPDDVPVVVVGPPRPTVRPVLTVSEDPPGGGPAAGIAAGVAALRETPTPLVVVLAGDAPFAPAAVPGLLTQLRRDPAADVAVALGADGRPQPLLAVYRTPALAAATAADLTSRPARALMDHLAAVHVPVPEVTTLDVDTPADLEAARRTARAMLRS